MASLSQYAEDPYLQNLKVKDAEYAEKASTFSSCAEELNSIVEEFFTILHSLKQFGMEGNTANSIWDFAVLVQCTLGAEKYSEIGSELAKDMESYIADLDAADTF